MALRGKIKVSSVNNLSDARYVAGMGVEYMGFDVQADSARRITPSEFSAITGWVSGVRLVGELEQIHTLDLANLTEDYKLDLVEVKDFQASDLQALSIPFALSINRPNIETLADVLSQYPKAEYFLINTAEFSSELWQNTMKDLVKHFPIIIGGDLNEEDALQWLEWGAIGVELKGGDEIKPGYKDFDGLADILEALEIDDVY